MTTTTEFVTIQEAAEYFSTQFELRKRADGSEYWARKDTSLPLEEGDSTLEALVVAAYDNREWFPDDVRYEYLVDALDILAETGDEDDWLQAVDNGVDIYTTDLTAWLHSHNSRLSYIDEVLDSESIWSKPETGSELLHLAQYLERYEVFEAVKAVLEKLVDV